MTSQKNIELDKIIKPSGNNLNMKVAKKLRELGWEVTISPYYVDDTSEKPREVDIIATKLIQYHTLNFSVSLFIECKHLMHPVIFWEKPNIFQNNVKNIVNNSLYGSVVAK
jgi:galactitol-specific phosphotransferase system IIB component